MSKIRLHGTSSGYTDIAPTAAAGNNTLTAPTGTGTLVAKDAAGAIGITSVQATNTNFSGTTRVTTGISTTLQVGGVNVLNSDGVNTTGIVTAKTFVPTEGQLSHRNLLVNGAMTVNQKGNLTHNSDGYQVADMWWWGKYSTDQLVTTQANVTNDHPDEFDHSYKLSVATAETTLDSNEYGILRTRIEGQNLQHLKTGTSSAKPITLSFWAKTASANSGDTYSVCIVMGDISGNDRIQYRTFAPTSTWQRFTMSFVGQENNQIRNDADYGLTIHYVLAAGSSKVTSANTTWSLNTSIKGVTGQSNFFDSTSNEFYVTGVQLEVGSVATPFEHRSYGDQLKLCKRYYQQYPELAADGYAPYPGSGAAIMTTTSAGWAMNYDTMRAAPTVSWTGNHRMVELNADRAVTGFAAYHGSASTGWMVITASGGGMTAGNAAIVGRNNDTSAFIKFTAEL